MTLLVDDRWTGRYGIGRFTRSVLSRLDGWQSIACPFRLLHPMEQAWFAARLACARGHTFFTPGFNAPAWSRIPTVITLHDLIHVRLPGPTKWRLYYELVVRPAARRAVAIATVSEFSRRDILDWTGLPPERVVVVGNGVDEEFSPAGDTEIRGRPYVLCVTNLFPHKNVPRLLRAFGISAARRDVELVVVAEPTPAIADLAARHAPGGVTFTGSVTDARLAALYRGATGCVQPSLFEGFGLPVIEAMASGTPVAHAAGSSLAEVAGGAGIGFEPEDDHAIAEAIDRLVFDSALRSELVPKGLERARAFRWDAVARRLAAVLSFG